MCPISYITVNRAVLEFALLSVLCCLVQAAGGGQHAVSRGAETEDRTAPERKKKSAPRQQHDAPAALFQVHGSTFILFCLRTI